MSNGDVGWLPKAVVEAICGATAQALANVRPHAHATAATVHARPGRVRATVSDVGVGFDSEAFRSGSRGISRSIVERTARVGGTADVVSVTARQSTNRHGTTWTLAWDGAVALTAEGHPRSRPKRIAREAMIEYGRGFITMFVVLAIVFHTLSSYPLLHHSADYRDWRLAVACWAVMTVAGGFLILGIYQSSISTTAARLAGLVVVLAAVTVAANCHPWAILGFANWALTDSVWLLVARPPAS